MKRIIDIPEEKYNRIINSYFGSKARPKDYEIAILNSVPLEQEPILDRVRAEIDKIYEREGSSFDCLNALDELKEFIDKYKAESEKNT